MPGKILVTGATGNVSSGLIAELKARGAEVRALVRDASKAQGHRDAGVEVVIGDLDKPETLDAAFSGVDEPQTEYHVLKCRARSHAIVWQVSHQEVALQTAP